MSYESVPYANCELGAELLTVIGTGHLTAVLK